MNPSERIDQLIAKLTDWRGKTFGSIRKTILDVDREIIEEWKWMGSPVWSHHGIIAAANAHKGKVKLTFSHGASLPDPEKLLNAGLEGNAWRAIDGSRRLDGRQCSATPHFLQAVSGLIPHLCSGVQCDQDQGALSRVAGVERSAVFVRTRSSISGNPAQAIILKCD
jgi:hypothetical protein